ncbi:MAG: lppY [Paenibacillus sp.]|nr:lppY [Paenibacillus sp.]
MAVSPLCRQFATILRAQPMVINGVCTASSVRNNIRPLILGKRSRSFLAIPQAFSFESIGRDGRALCLGETVILTAEINPFISRLRRHGIKVTALHNHWLFTNPNLWYIHFEKTARPLNFARDVRDALDVLTTRVVRPRIVKK